MTAEILLYHLRELGVVVALGEGCRTLELEAPKGVLTAELTELLRERRDDLIELIYVEEERAAIQEIDGRPTRSLVPVEAPVTSHVFSPAQALERARAVSDDRAFKQEPEEVATWQPPDVFLERMEATFA
jgi:methylase of polypeptide subunit release factors